MSFYNEIKLIFNDSSYGKKYGKMSLGLLLLAVSYNLFICPINLVSGGAGGLGVLFRHLFGIQPSLVVFFVSFLMFVLAFLFLDAEQVVSTFFVAIVYPLMVRATSGISGIIGIDTSHVLVIVVFGAILSGLGQGYIFKLGLNFGGFSVLAKIINKYTKISVTLINAIINGVIVMFGAYYFGISMLFYAILFIVISRYVSEKIMLGISFNKTFKIISSEYLLIEKFIYEELGHDVTVYDTYGAYSKGDRKLLMVVIPSSEYGILKEYVKSVDRAAFIFVADTYEASGQDISIAAGKCV